MTGVPRPQIRAPSEFNMRPRSTISGSQAAPRMTVRPRASTAAQRTFAVPVTVGPRGPQRSIVGAAKLPGRGHDITAIQPQIRTQGSQPAEMQIDGPVADAAAAGQRHDRPAPPCQQRPQDAESGPHPPHQGVACPHHAGLDRGQQQAVAAAGDVDA